MVSGILLFYGVKKGRGDVPRPLPVVLFLLLSAGLLGPWQVRNRAQAGYAGFSAISEVNLYFYQAAAVLAAQQGAPFYEMQNRMGYRDPGIYFRNHPEQRVWTAGERYRFMRAEALKVILSHPLTFASVHARGLARVLLDPGAIDYLKRFNLYPEYGGLLGTAIDKGLVRAGLSLFRERPLAFWSNLLMEIALLAYLALSAIGFAFRSSFRSLPVLLLLVAGTYLFVLSGGAYSLGRFRHPLMPIVCIFAGNGLWHTYRYTISRSFTRTRSDPSSAVTV